MGRQQGLVARRAGQRAFESFLRWGRAPDPVAELKAAARDVSLRTLGAVRPTTHYTWRTARDPRVRDAHAAHEGRVFAWAAPPPGGHPGTAPNCRCWAEPYYGTPGVPDTRLPLTRQRVADISGTATWQSIETLKRPDGSVAQSLVVLRDGTRVQSSFAGDRVENAVRLTDGQLVRLVREAGLQSVYLGQNQAPVVQSVWTADGPKPVQPRTRVAMELLLQGTRDLPQPVYSDEAPALPKPPVGVAVVDQMATTIATGVMAFRALQAVAASMGQAATAGIGKQADAIPVAAFRVWQDNRGVGAELFALALLTAAQVANSCKRLPEVQSWTTEAALYVGPVGSAQSRGTAIHKSVENRIKLMKQLYPAAYSDIRTEWSVSMDAVDMSYGALGSTRLDVLELLPSTVCIYDIKTGDAGLSPKRIKRLAEIAAAYGKLTFFVIEVRPFQ